MDRTEQIAQAFSEIDVKKPYDTSLKFSRILSEINPLLSEATKIDLKPMYDTLGLRYLPEEIGRDLDLNPTWVKNALAMCRRPTDIKEAVWSAAKRMDSTKFAELLERTRRPVRSVAEDAWESCMMDVFPRMAAICDFDLRDQEHFGSLQYAVRSGVSKYELDSVLGNGKAITELCQSFPDNPYKHVVFVTAYDGMTEE